jgi:hypothetical protein
MSSMPVDPKALRILTQMWWSSRGWRVPPELPSAEDFAYARGAGLLFDAPQIDHDQLPLQIRRTVLRISVDDVSEAFVSSLSSRRLDLRSALASFVIGRAVPIHSFPLRHSVKVVICPVCGALAPQSHRPADWNRFSFERHRWGGVWIHDPYFLAFDLEQFAAGDHPVATHDDWELMRDLLKVIREASAADANLRPGGLANAIRVVLPKSNESQRRKVVQALAAIGVLEPQAHQSFRNGWVEFGSRPDPPEPKSNWFYPSGFWRGSDGVNVSAVREFFPRLADLS